MRPYTPHLASPVNASKSHQPAEGWMIAVRRSG
jgi:hypothetical protein